MDLPQFLDRLDFTSYEKQVILFLASVDNADAHTIYKQTHIPKGRIYSVLNLLNEKKFVNIIPTNPKKYQLENIKDSLRYYLGEKISFLDKNIQDIQHVELQPKSFTLPSNAPSVYTFTGRDEHLNALISLRNRAKKRILQVAPIFTGTFASNLAIYKALQRGIKMKIITLGVTQQNKKHIHECLQLGAEVRQLNSPDLVYFLLRDHEEFVLGLENYHNQEERLNIISKNKGLLLVLEKYFEHLWAMAKPI